MAEGSTPIEIFCCYAREDEMWLRKLETHLSLLQRQELISLWYDRLVTSSNGLFPTAAFLTSKERVA